MRWADIARTTFLRCGGRAQQGGRAVRMADNAIGDRGSATRLPNLTLLCTAGYNVTTTEMINAARSLWCVTVSGRRLRTADQ
jgi:hypothetical protein